MRRSAARHAPGHGLASPSRSRLRARIARVQQPHGSQPRPRGHGLEAPYTDGLACCIRKRYHGVVGKPPALPFSHTA